MPNTQFLWHLSQLVLAPSDAVGSMDVANVVYRFGLVLWGGKSLRLRAAVTSLKLLFQL